MKSALITIGRYLASLLLLAVVWHIIVVLFSLPSYIMPKPLEVWDSLCNEWFLYGKALRYTISNMLSGAVIGIGLGLVAGALFALSSKLRWVAEPYLVIFQSFPRESLLPLMIVWLGFGAASKIANSALLSFFPVAVLTLQALTNTRHDYLALVNTYGATPFKRFWHVQLPCAVPGIMGALKVGFPLALIGAVLGEFMGSDQGLGYVILTSGAVSRADRIFGAVVLLAIIGTSMFAIIALLERSAFRRFYETYRN